MSWTCVECGGQGDASADYCHNCGTSRDASIRIGLAFNHFENGDYESAVRDFEEARGMGYSTAKSEQFRGHAYHMLRRPAESIAALSAAVELDPSNAFAYGLRGWNLVKLGFVDEAVASLGECLRLEPNHVQATFSMGVALRAAGETEYALTFFERAASLGHADASGVAAALRDEMSRAKAAGGQPPAGAASPEDRPFVECMNTFARHEYVESADAALQLLSKRMFQWLMQVLLISLERNGRFDILGKMGDYALESFEEHPWAVALLKLTLGQTTPDAIRPLADDPRKEFQLSYYEAASLLTKGDRAAALALFGKCANLQMECAEQFLATSESENPEPPLKTLERLVVRAARFRQLKQVDDCVRSAGLALEIARAARETGDAGVVKCLDYLSTILSELGDDARTETLLGELNDVVRSSTYPVPQRNSRAVAEMGASISVAMRAPLSTFSGTLKQVNAERLSFVQRAAISFGFPSFLGRPPAFEHPEHYLSKELRKEELFKDATKGSPYARRRYSGDASQEFPRSRYHAVCSDESGDDNRTLIQELNEYTVTQLTGYCVARSTSSPLEIELVFRGLPGWPNPLAQALSDPDRYDTYLKSLPNEARELRESLRSPELKRAVTDAEELVIPVECSLSRCEIANCLDLRQPKARAWVVEFFRAPPEGLIGESLRALMYAHHFDPAQVAGWGDLLPVLNSRNVGGNPLIDMFGAFLRNIGCAALVYPSARSDYMAYFEGGSLKKFWGWNLVDYRGIPPSGRVGIDFGDLIEPLVGPSHLEELTEGPHAGSIAFYGNTLYSRVVNELAYTQRVKIELAEWLIKSKKDEMFVRGYFWYKKRYSFDDRAPLLICDRCETRFSDEATELLPACPMCEYPGDV